MGERICVVSSGCLSSGPRVVKEADALAEAGYAVHVVVCHTLPWMEAWDQELASGRGWSYEAVRWDANTRRASAVGVLSAGASRAARLLSDLLGGLPGPDELAHSAATAPLLKAVLAQRADLYIAHNLAALPVARAASRLHRARLAFDAEDDHFGELNAPQQTSAEGQRVHALMDRHLPSCAYVSAASPAMGEALAARHGITPPVVVHNVFPWSEREGLDGLQKDRQGDALSLCWYSQSLGLDRGLQDLIAAAGRLKGDVQVHLRGDADADVRAELERLGAEAGVAGRLWFHGQVPPGELLSRCAEHDVGFALEQPVSDNRMRTVTNKLFFYLLAGLAVAATETTGQRAVLAEAPDVGFTYAPGDIEALTQGLQRWLDDPAALERAKTAALSAAERRFSWERERTTLVDAVRRALSVQR